MKRIVEFIFEPLLSLFLFLIVLPGFSQTGISTKEDTITISGNSFALEAATTLKFEQIDMMEAALVLADTVIRANFKGGIFVLDKKEKQKFIALLEELFADSPKNIFEQALTVKKETFVTQIKQMGLSEADITLSGYVNLQQQKKLLPFSQLLFNLLANKTKEFSKTKETLLLVNQKFVNGTTAHLKYFYPAANKRAQLNHFIYNNLEIDIPDLVAKSELPTIEKKLRKQALSRSLSEQDQAFAFDTKAYHLALEKIPDTLSKINLKGIGVGLLLLVLGIVLLFIFTIFFFVYKFNKDGKRFNLFSQNNDKGKKEAEKPSDKNQNSPVETAENATRRLKAEKTSGIQGENEKHQKNLEALEKKKKRIDAIAKKLGVSEDKIDDEIIALRKIKREYESSRYKKLVDIIQNKTVDHLTKIKVILKDLEEGEQELCDYLDGLLQGAEGYSLLLSAFGISEQEVASLKSFLNNKEQYKDNSLFVNEFNKKFKALKVALQSKPETNPLKSMQEELRNQFQNSATYHNYKPIIDELLPQYAKRILYVIFMEKIAKTTESFSKEFFSSKVEISNRLFYQFILDTAIKLYEICRYKHYFDQNSKNNDHSPTVKMLLYDVKAYELYEKGAGKRYQGDPKESRLAKMVVAYAKKHKLKTDLFVDGFYVQTENEAS